MVEKFDFLRDMGNIAERRVAVYGKDEDGLFVSTMAISDSTKPFETAIGHPDYDDGNLIIVELYDTKEEAEIGHDKWVDTMSNNPPRQLIDVSTAWAASRLREMGELPAFEKKA